jgi:hypothetical protein
LPKKVYHSLSFSCPYTNLLKFQRINLDRIIVDAFFIHVKSFFSGFFVVISYIEVEAVVDTGAAPLVIPENLRLRLGLEIEKTSAVMLAGGKREACAVADPVEIIWNDRDTSSRPIVLAGETDEVLLGAYPLEEMDLMARMGKICPAKKVTSCVSAVWPRQGPPLRKTAWNLAPATACP